MNQVPKSQPMNPPENSAQCERGVSFDDCCQAGMKDILSEESAHAKARLRAPARVGNTNFSAGIEERLVIEAAQRHFKLEGQRKSKTPEEWEAEEANRRHIWDLINGPLRITKVPLAANRAHRIYIAGPMTGLPDLNYPAFHAAAKELRDQGWHVENPAEHGVVTGAEWADYLAFDLTRLGTCGAIYLLPGWENSKGAKLEVQIAVELGFPIMAADFATTKQAFNRPSPDMVSVKKEDANNLCRILTALGMEEEGDPVAEVHRLLTASQPVAQGLDAQAVPVAYELGDFRIARRSSAEDEQESWAVLWRGMCLDKSGTYSHEPQPSSRTDNWLVQHRFASAHEAAAAALAAQAKQGGAA